MSSHHDHSGHRGAPGPAASGTIRRWKWVFGGFAALAALLLAFEHRMHLSGLIGWLPWLILLACPLMHVFMHGGHGHGEAPDKGEEK
ncbi:DUF2933 domain-containing protein [Denitromonas sp.]|jgi:hypothetical protein|uniref:DUF2933 domain-containing protein n=1 Tax=Denitromonas sp. TaxID=2734609 RepID=UPI002AFF59D1|nr:DUF2933 domain-containing protein [Denitromonas sp.]|tara:strand:+ start:17724 stop:17984 length:261 start_codon:yes stop_codon:yes gene_type:complete